MDRTDRGTIRKEWGYGWVFFGYEVNERTINYIIKYITKRDESNPEFNGKIFTSKRIGINYINKNTLKRHRYQDKFTEETYRTNSGIKQHYQHTTDKNYGQIKNAKPYGS